ncbi:MAG: CPBP family intramembrane metalloprotease [Bacteroidales bacterium]|nr:CPBP family intramembrane metalloprotease [Bacteroidales bacterium]
MFFESALEGKNQWWRYLVVVLVAFGAAMTIGNIPLLIAVVIAGVKNPDAVQAIGDNPTDLSSFGLGNNLTLILIVVAFLIGLIAFALMVKPMNGRPLKSFVNGRKKVRWNRILISFLVWSLLFAIYLIVIVKIDPENYLINNTGSGLIVLAITALVFLPFQTTFEEFIFRGYLMQGFGVAFRNKWAPFLITSILFGLMHAPNPEVKEFGFLIMMPQYIFIGLVFGLITVLDDGIELAIGAHAANNIFLSIFVTQKSSAIQTDALYEQQNVFPGQDSLALLLVSLAFILIMYLIYKWKMAGAFSFKK